MVNYGVISENLERVRYGVISGKGLSIAFSPNAMPHGSCKINRNQFTVRTSSSVKEQVVAGLTAAAFLAPEIAEAVQPGISPSLKNFLLRIALGGVGLGAILGAVVRVSNFDPVKRA